MRVPSYGRTTPASFRVTDESVPRSLRDAITGRAHPMGTVGIGTSHLDLFKATDGSQWVVKRHGKGDIAREDMFGRSRAFFLTSKRLGLHVVPRTFVGEENGTPVLFQRHVKGNSSYRVECDWDNLVAIAILHYVTGISDGHALQAVGFSHQGRTRAAAIDGELTFGVERPLTSNAFFEEIKNRAGRDASLRIPTRISESLAAADIEAWRGELRGQAISEAQIDAAVLRLGQIKTRGLQVF